MSEETKRRILEAGAELIHQNGFNNTGLKDILQAAGVPKGSFYFYFDNKEAFGLALVDYYNESFATRLRPILKDDSTPPLEKLRCFFDLFHGYFESQRFSRGCPVGNLAAEMSDLSEPFRVKLDESMDRIIYVFTTLLDQAQGAGDIAADIDTQETAVFILEAWHGALTRMKVKKSSAPLDTCYKFIFNKVLG